MGPDCEDRRNYKAKLVYEKRLSGSGRRRCIPTRIQASHVIFDGDVRNVRRGKGARGGGGGGVTKVFI